MASTNDEDNVRAEVMGAFKMHGYTLRSDAAQRMSEWMRELDEPCKRREMIDRVIAQMHKLPLESSLIDMKLLTAAVVECTQQENHELNAFEVIDVFTVPQMEYCMERGKFIDRTNFGLGAPQLHADADSKARLHRCRFNTILQRVQRHELFSIADRTADSGSNKFRLRPIEELLGSSGRLIENVVLLGMLVQMKPGKFHLEDPTGTIELDLSTTKFHTGLFTENCVVLVEGTYTTAKRLVATNIGMPPVERADSTRVFLGGTDGANMFGGKSMTHLSAKLRHYEHMHDEVMIVFAADVCVDRSDVLTALRTLFTGYARQPPLAFVFMGDFCSPQQATGGAEQCQALKDGFKALADVVCEFENIRYRSHFVFVPSCNDPALGDVLPRPALPDNLTQSFRQRIPKCHMATNPCRLRYCTQEMVVFREDIIEKMCRNSIEMTSDKKEVAKDFVRTITSQAHLSPLPLHVSPIYWDFDHALRLYPVPDLVVIGDRYQPFAAPVDGADTGQVVCTSSFAHNKFTFHVYFPADRRIDLSEVTTDALL